MIKAIVFDLDHTLFDRHGTLTQIVPMLRAAFSIRQDLTDEEIAEKWIYADDHFVYDGWSYIFAYLVENGVFETAPDFSEYRSFIYKAFAKVAVPFPGTIPMLEQLRRQGYKTGLITNGHHSLQYKKLRMLGLTPYFDEIIVSGDVMVDKPDREIFRMMCEKLNYKPSEMIYIGDNPKTDIAGSRSAGYHTIWMKSTGQWQFGLEPPEWSVSKVEDIPDAVALIDRK